MASEEGSSRFAVGTGTEASPDKPEHGSCTTIVNCCDDHAPKHLIVHEEKDCCFEVYMSRCKVIANNDGKAEIMLTGYANDQQATFPGMGLWFQHHRNWDWRTLHKKVGRFHVEKGQQLPVYLMLDAIEADESAAGNWEMGSSQNPQTIYLRCGVGTTRTSLVVDTKKVKNWSPGVTSTIEVEFAAFEVSCCCCD